MTVLDEGEIAECVAQLINGELPTSSVERLGWIASGALDIGEVEITLCDGSRFRMTIEKTED